jgi:hypothetical protein
MIPTRNVFTIRPPEARVYSTGDAYDATNSVEPSNARVATPIVGAPSLAIETPVAWERAARVRMSCSNALGTRSRGRWDGVGVCFAFAGFFVVVGLDFRFDAACFVDRDFDERTDLAADFALVCDF